MKVIKGVYYIFLIIFIVVAVASTVLFILDYVVLASIIFVVGIAVSVLILLFIILPKEKKLINKQNKFNSDE